MSEPLSSYTIGPARSETDLKDIILLFYAYAKSLGIDLSFQDFDTEMATLPGKYAPPTGELLVARHNTTGSAIGCVALRSFPDDERKVAEMKRLYVTLTGRGSGLGRALAVKIIEVAKELGYAEVRLDTLPDMRSAQALYKNLGFQEMNKYYDTPMEDTVFLKLRLPRATVRDTEPPVI